MTVTLTKAPRKTILLIDADALAYRCAAAVEIEEEIDDGYWVWSCNEDEVKAAILGEIGAMKDRLDATDTILCLTDTVNFRHDILPTYKCHRQKVKRPVTLKSIRSWLVEEHGARIKPTLEGDDIMGILSTMPHPEDEWRVIVSPDKDMRTIPGLFCQDWRGDGGIEEITEAEADRFHMWQTLVGDPTDGYKGCPGVGATKADKVLDLCPADEPAMELLQDRLWHRIRCAYEKAGLTEDDAIVQARVARICRFTDWDGEKQRVIPWSPPRGLS